MLDVGYSFIVEAARLAFPSLPDNHLRAPALQLVMDAGRRSRSSVTSSGNGTSCSDSLRGIYASNGVFYDLVSFAITTIGTFPTFFVRAH